MSVDGENLKSYCKNCNFSTIDNFATHAECILETNHGVAAERNYEQYMNKYIIHDPTLPRVNNIKCPSCDVQPNKVIYIKYDHVNMKYLYFCCNCEHFWR